MHFPYIFVVIKAERIPNDDVDDGYTFPDNDDDLTKYKGGAVQLMVAGDLLQDISKSFITAPSTSRCLLIIKCTTYSK